MAGTNSIRRLILFAIPFLSSEILFSQSAKLDSLKLQLKSITDSPVRVDLLNRIAAGLFDYDSKLAYEYAVNAGNLANQLNYVRGKKEALTLQGFRWFEITKYAEATRLYRQALQLPDTDAKDLQGYTFTMMGNLFLAKAEYDSALLHYNKARTILEGSDSKFRLSILYKNLGRLFLAQWKNEEALDYFTKALAIRFELKDSVGIGDSWITLGQLQLNLSNYPLAKEYFTKACQIGNKLGDDFLKVQCYFNMGDTYFRLSEYDEALKQLFVALELLKDKDFPSVTASTYFKLGEVYEELGQFEIASKYLFQAAQISEKAELKNLTGKIYSEIAWIFKQRLNFDMAMNYINKSLSLRESIGDLHGIANCYNVIGLIKYQQKSYDEAASYLQKSITIRKELKHDEGLAASISNMSLIYEDQKQHEKALGYQLEASKIEEKIGNRNALGITYNSIGNLYIKLGNLSQAERFLEKARTIAEDTGAKLLLKNNYGYFADLYEAKGNYRLALDFQKKFKQLNDSLYSEKSSSRLAEMEALYQLEKKENEIQLLNRERKIQNERIYTQQESIRQQRTVIFLALVVLAMISLGAIIGYRYYREKSKSNRELTKLNKEINEQKEEIQAQSEELVEASHTIAQINVGLETKVEERTNELRQAYKELDTFFYRSSHDFRRPLTTFLGLAEVAKVTVKDKNALELFDKVKDTAHNLDKMLIKLQSISDLGGQHLVFKEVFIRELIDEIASNFSEDIKGKGIHLQVAVELKEAFSSYPAMVKIIIENLIENAIHFAGMPNPYIRIRAFQQDGQLVMEVEDNGQGILSEYQDRVFDMYFRANERSKGNGLGLYIVKKAVEKLEGQIIMRSEYAKGTTFTVTLPFQA